MTRARNSGRTFLTHSGIFSTSSAGGVPIIGAGPLGKINAYDYSELQPYAGFHLLNSQTLTPAVCGFLGQIDKRPLVRFEIFDFGEDLSMRGKQHVSTRAAT